MAIHKTQIPFHPLVWRWFTERFTKPTAPQELGWKYISEGKATLIAAPTGSGKTLAAFLWSIDRLIQRALAGRLEDKTSVVYVSPLKALGNDIQKNLEAPLAGIVQLAKAQKLDLPEIRVAVRSGDTPQRERQLMVRYPPHILITTPESLYILLTAERSRQFLRTAETVVVDEIHAVAGDKRGSHLALSLERLDALAERPLQRIGLSATQKPIEEIGWLLVGTERIRPDGPPFEFPPFGSEPQGRRQGGEPFGPSSGRGLVEPECAIVDVGHQRHLDLSIEIPEQELGAIAKHEIWAEIYERVTAQIRAHRTTLVFVNTRRLVERVAHQLTSRLGEGKVGAHHGSLSRKTRLEVEQGLKSGALAVVVATASLELGIDIGHVDLVCHIGSPRTLATFLQRVGRSGHTLGATPRGILYPLTRDDLLQCAAAIRSIKAGALDRVYVPEKPLDILAQQMVATAASLNSGMPVGELWRLVKKAYPYRNLTRREFDEVLEMLCEGIASRRGRRSAYLHYDRVHGRLRARRGARMIAITNGGAIPDTADYDVIKVPDEVFVGRVNEDFAIESLAGDIFLLGNSSWRIRRVSAGKVWVEDAHGLPPSIPFWLGEAPGRSLELSGAVSDLRFQVVSRLEDPSSPLNWLMEETRVPESGAGQIVSYIRETRSSLGCVPTLECVVAERFFDEAGGMQLVLHAPFGGRINRAWGLALRKRFCVTFDREIQAAATDDGIVISLGEQHSFPLGDVFSWLHPANLEKDLTQAALASPMFTNRWRWNSGRALALLRHSGGRKVPMAIQRMRAEDLLAAVFPEQLMCQDNRVGPIQVPDHPLVQETLRDCLREAMDAQGLKQVLEKLRRGEIRTVAVETPAPSPMAHEILNANPYAFLDDAPLEERRARAVALRRTDPDLRQGMGALNPEAIEEVRRQAWPEIRDAEELHDFLLSVCLLPLGEAQRWTTMAQELIGSERATVACWSLQGAAGECRAYVAAERISVLRAVFPEARLDPVIPDPFSGANSMPLADEAIRKIVHGWMDVIGPSTAGELAQRLGLSVEQVWHGLHALESAGVVLRGQFTPGRSGEEIEWCERGLLSRIHRLTLGRLRREIEPVTAADFIRFLLSWQHVQPVTRLNGREGVMEIIGQLQGLELPAPAWEQQVLPSRLSDYKPADLEDLCLAGIVAWGRLRMDAAPAGEEEGNNIRTKAKRRLRAPTRSAPIALILREDLPYFIEPIATSWGEIELLSHAARDVTRYLEQHGASFLADIARGTGLLKAGAEEALWELVARGVVSGDGIAGLRVLLTPQVKRRPRRLRVISGGRAPERLMPVGRWSLWRASGHEAGSANSERAGEFKARQLLRRYGLFFRELLARETCMPSWRTLLEIYRRLEARGEIRGGRFVSGFFGEQFALPEAVELLRAVRRSKSNSETVILSCADPLNLVGILTPGARVSPYSNQAIVYRDGVPVDVGPLGAVRSRLRQTQAEEQE